MIQCILNYRQLFAKGPYYLGVAANLPKFARTPHISVALTLLCEPISRGTRLLCLLISQAFERLDSEFIQTPWLPVFAVALEFLLCIWLSKAIIALGPHTELKETALSKNYQTKWENSHIYLGLDDPKLNGDLERLQGELAKINAHKLSTLETQITGLPEAGRIDLALLADAVLSTHEVYVDLSQILVFVKSIADTENNNQQAIALQSKCEEVVFGRLQETRKSIYACVRSLDDREFESLATNRDLEHFVFTLERERSVAPYSLSLNEEKLLAGMSVKGLLPWGKLHREISANVAVAQANGTKKSFSQLKGGLFSENEAVRKKAYQDIETGFNPQLDTCAASLNAISGWRLAENEKRSHIKPKGILDGSLHSCRLSEASLDSMISAVDEHIEVGRDALRAMAGFWGKDKLDPWDLLAGANFGDEGKEQKISYPDAIDMISTACGKIDPQMADFCQMMAKNGWIDCEESKTKREGAYCTGFFRLREPRVLMSYNGTMAAVMTLAHELGHAYHNWVLRQLPMPAVLYPMTLAESASIFTETLVSDQLLALAKTHNEKLPVLWQQAGNAVSFIINIPTRFAFEKKLYELRKTRSLSAAEISQLNHDTWQHYYGDTLSAPDRTFWATKLHFYMTQVEFYNFPYTFGYLFALGIYSKKDEANFANTYRNLLMDTGRMTCEAVAEKHLHARLDEPDFWRAALGQAKAHVDNFAEALANR